MFKLNQVHQHNQRVYGHPVAAFQKTIQSRAVEQGDLDISPSAVMAHSLQSGKPIRCCLTVSKYGGDGQLEKVHGNIESEIHPILMDSHTVGAFINVPEGVEVPHDHVVEYELSAGDQQSSGLVSNFFSAVADNEPKVFAPGTHTTMAGDMYDSDRYADYRRQKMPIASMLVSGISTGKSDRDVTRVGSIQLMSSYDLPKERANLRFQGVPRYVGDEGVSRGALHGKRVGVDFNAENAGEGYEDMGRDGTSFLINMAFLHALHEKFGSEAGQKLYSEEYLEGLLGDTLSDRVKAKYTGELEGSFPSLFHLLNGSSGLGPHGSMVGAVYKQNLAMVQGAEIGERFQMDPMDLAMNSSAAHYKPGTSAGGIPGSLERILLLTAYDQLTGVDEEITIFAKVRDRVRKLFNLEEGEGPYVIRPEVNGELVYMLSEDMVGWAGQNLAMQSKALLKLFAPLIDVSSLMEWVLSNHQYGAAMKLNEQQVAMGAIRFLGTYWRIGDRDGGWYYALTVNTERSSKARIVYMNDKFEVGMTAQGASIDSISDNLNVQVLSAEGMGQSAAASSSSSSSSSLVRASGFGFDDELNGVYTGTRFAPLGHQALTINDVMMAKPTSDQHMSVGSEARSLDHLIGKPLFGALIDPIYPTPEVLTISPSSDDRLYKVERNGQAIGVAVYDPVINQYRFSNDPFHGKITHSFQVDKHGVSFNENYYANDLDKAIPARKQIAEEIERIKSEDGAKTPLSIEEQIFAASSSDSSEPADYPWTELSSSQTEPVGFALEQGDEEEGEEGAVGEEMIGARARGRRARRRGGRWGRRGGRWRRRRGGWLPYLAAGAAAGLGRTLLGGGVYAAQPW